MKKIIFIFLLCILSVQISNAQWVQMSNGMVNNNTNVISLAYSGNNIFAGTDYGIYLSTNNGTSWTQTPLNNYDVYSLAVNGNNIFAGISIPSEGVYLSTNNGTSWAQTSLNNLSVRSLAVNGNNIFAGTGDFGVYLSTNNGTSWTQTSLNNQSVSALAANGNYIFAGTYIYGVYLSTNNGANWTQTSLNNQSVSALAANGNYIFAGTEFFNGVYLSTDNGTSWTQTSLNNQWVNSLAVNGNNVFAGTYNNGVYVSNDNGANWTQSIQGLPNSPTIWSLSILNNYIFAGTVYCVYRRPLSEVIGIQPISTEIPNQFSLSQNYPNPFNPSTKFKVDIVKLSNVTIKVFDVLGREITTLVNEQLKPGVYEVDWNADKFTSGIYFYKLTSGDYTETKKMILSK